MTNPEKKPYERRFAKKLPFAQNLFLKAGIFIAFTGVGFGVAAMVPGFQGSSERHDAERAVAHLSQPLPQETDQAQREYEVVVFQARHAGDDELRLADELLATGAALAALGISTALIASRRREE